MIDRENFKKWKLVFIVFIIGFILLFSGLVGFLTPSIQIVIKKAFLLSLWYGFAYIVRVERIGHIDWNDDYWKKIYYFVLLIGSALIIALG